MKKLKPIYDFNKYSTPIAKEIYALLKATIFDPLYQIMEPMSTKLNAKANNLIQALQSGKMQYVNEYFIGPLNISITKELRGIGARYNKVKKAFQLERSKLPQDVLLAASEADQLAKAQLEKVQNFLYAIEGRTLKAPEIKTFLGDTISGLNKQFQDTTKTISGRDLEIPIDPRLAEDIKDAYTVNLDMYINNWYDEQILRLRQKVAKNVEAGFRAEKLISDIQYEKKVSYNKAKFLAKQETSLMVSKYREIRYEEVGISRYMWSTSRDVRVRHDHKELQGKIFSFNQPPVTNHATMARNNPGEDYGCRCVAIPVLSTINMLELEHANDRP